MTENELRELDAEIALKVFGWTREQVDTAMLCATGSIAACNEMTTGPIPEYSTDIAAAWLVVAEVQRRNPGWRFSLLGGDSPFPTLIVGKRRRTGKARLPFGWHAEFFGHEDPKLCTGQRHGSEYADTAPLAICKAALSSVETRP